MNTTPSEKKNTPKSSSHSPTSGSVEYVGFWRRFAAMVYDSILVMLMMFVITFVLFFLGLNDLASLVGLILGVGYVVGFWVYRDGQTPGKMLLKAKVVPEEGKNITWVTAIIRYLGYILSGIIIYLGFIWVAFDKKKQGWHDKIARTYVVSTGKPHGFVYGFGIFLGVAGILLGILSIVAIIVGMILFASSEKGQGFMKMFSDKNMQKVMMNSVECTQECKGEADAEECTKMCVQDKLKEQGITEEELQKSLMESGVLNEEQMEMYEEQMEQMNESLPEEELDMYDELQDIDATTSDEELREMEKKFEEQFGEGFDLNIDNDDGEKEN